MGFTPVAAIIVAIARDHNTRMAAQAALDARAEQEQAELMSTVFQSMSDALVLSDAEDRVTLSNRAAGDLLGSALPTRVRPAGTPLPSWSEPHEDAVAISAEQLAELLVSSPRHGQHELVVAAAGGDSRRVSLLRHPISVDGSTATLHLIADITQEHARQRELETFAGTLAHDLKGPLTAVTGWLDAAADELEDGDSESALAATRRAGSASVRMRAMIEDYLAYTVRRNGEVSRTTLELQSLIEDIAAVYEGVDRTGVVFEIDTPHQVHADAALTRQLLANLITNSVKYSRPGQPAQIRVTSAPEPPSAPGEPEWIRVQVADRGVGIQPGEEEAIFGAYQRSDKDAADYQGIGLGLSLCAQIVARHGGWIAAANNAHGGATLTFTLPQARYEPADLPGRGQPQHPARPAHPPGLAGLHHRLHLRRRNRRAQPVRA